MNSIKDTVNLSNGIEIPCIGLGTWECSDSIEALNEITETAVLNALSCGYRLLDTAAVYLNEKGVGRGIKRSGLKRSEVFLTSKLGNDIRGYADTLSAFEKSLEEFETDYLDLYLIHWPNPRKFRDDRDKYLLETWRAFEDLYKAGRIKAIGVSNFLPHHLEVIERNADIMPMVNQIKLCPGIIQRETVVYCKEKGIILEAYSPFGSGKVFESDKIKNLADKYGKSVAQICLRWSVQNGFIPIPHSSNVGRLKQNTAIFDFVLDDKEMEYISGIEVNAGEIPDPDA